jgi:transitional endoplasmic reticulum ATPase
MWFG